MTGGSIGTCWITLGFSTPSHLVVLSRLPHQCTAYFPSLYSKRQQIVPTPAVSTAVGLPHSAPVLLRFGGTETHLPSQSHSSSRQKGKEISHCPEPEATLDCKVGGGQGRQQMVSQPHQTDSPKITSYPWWQGRTFSRSDCLLRLS